MVDHCTRECLGLHAARRGTRFEALEALHQAVRHSFGHFKEKVAEDKLALRHDHGSQFVSGDYQDELKFLGIKSTPAFVAELSARAYRGVDENLDKPSIDALRSAWMRRWGGEQGRCRRPDRTKSSPAPYLASAADR